MGRKGYPPEFRRKVLDLVAAGRSVAAVATLLDGSGLSARFIADQLGHLRVSMTQDFYLGRRAVDGAVALALGELSWIAGEDSPGQAAG